MAQQKRLTRAQKVLLSRIQSGFKVPSSTNPVDLKTLEDRGLIILEGGRWAAVPQPEAAKVVAGDVELQMLKEKFS